MDKNNTPEKGARLSLHSVRSLFSEAWELYKEHWRVLVEIILLPALVMALGYVLRGIALGSLFSLLGSLLIFIGWILFSFSVVTVIFSLHHKTGVDASYQATIKWFWPFVWLIILEILAVAGGFVMLIIPGIWLAFSFSFAVYVFVVEQRRGLDVLRQSKEYVKGYWWAVVGRVVLLGLAFSVIGAVVKFCAAFLAGTIGAGIASVALAVFFVPFSVIYTYLIFKNLRELKPSLVEVQTKEGKGFIKASAIVGLVIPIVAIVALIVAVALGVASGTFNRYDSHFVPPPGYGMQDGRTIN